MAHLATTGSRHKLPGERLVCAVLGIDEAVSSMQERRKPTPASCFGGADPLSNARLTPPADFLEGTPLSRDRHPVSDFFTQGQKIRDSTRLRSSGGPPAHAIPTRLPPLDAFTVTEPERTEA
jgi:hypothetical protein